MNKKIDWLEEAVRILEQPSKLLWDDQTFEEIQTISQYAQACIALHNAKREAEKDKKSGPPLYEFDGKGGVRYVHDKIEKLKSALAESEAQVKRLREFFESLCYGEAYEHHFLNDDGSAFQKAVDLGLLVEVPRTSAEMEFAEDDGDTRFVEAWSARAALSDQKGGDDDE